MTADFVVAEQLFQPSAPQTEIAYLTAGEVVHLGVFAAGEVRENRLNLHHIAQLVESLRQTFDILFHKAETVHASIEFNMNGIRLVVVAVRSLGKEVKYAKAVDIWFQAVFDDALETLLFGIHHHDGQCDAVLAEVHTLVGIGHSKIVHIVGLQCVGNLNTAGTIGESLDHGHQLGVGTDARTEIVEVADKGVEVHLHYGFVRLALEQLGNLLEMEHTCAFQQNCLVLEVGKQVVGDEILGIAEENAVFVEFVGVARKCLANAYKLGHTTLLNQLCHCGIQFRLRQSRLHYVRQNQSLFLVLPFLTQEVEGYRQRVDIQTISIIHQLTAVYAVLHFETHGHGQQTLGFALDVGQSPAQIEQQRDAVHGVLNRAVVGKRNVGCKIIALVTYCKRGIMLCSLGIEQSHRRFLRHAPSKTLQGAEFLVVFEGVDDVGMVLTAYKHFAIGEETQFFGNLCLKAGEILVVRLSDICQHADGRTHNILQTRHFAGLGDTCLEHCKVIFGTHLPNGERHANLRVVAFGARNDVVSFREQLHNPVLDHGLAVAARYSHHGNAVLLATALGQSLQSGHHIIDYQHVGTFESGNAIGESLALAGGKHKAAHPFAVKLVNVTATRVSFGGDGEKQSGVGTREGTAVGEQSGYFRIFVGNADRQRRKRPADVFDSVGCHFQRFISKW